MNSARALVIAVSVILGGQVASAQDVSRYRGYVLESSLESVIAVGTSRAADVKTLHERPAKIQELEWRPPYMASGSQAVDPVRGITFTFYDGSLYQIVVTYERDRTDGLTNGDIIESLSATYGAPVLEAAGARTSRPVAPLPDTIAVARWENAASSRTRLRATYSPGYQLILITKPLRARAGGAIREAVKLDAIEAPRRDVERRAKEIADASLARDKARTTNKSAFRP